MPKKKPKPEPVADEFVIMSADDSQLLRPEPEPVVETQPSPPVRNTLTAEEIRIRACLAEWGRR